MYRTLCGLVFYKIDDNSINLDQSSFSLRKIKPNDRIEPALIYPDNDIIDNIINSWKEIIPSLELFYSCGRTGISIEAKDAGKISVLLNKILETHNIYINDSCQANFQKGSCYSCSKKEDIIYKQLMELNTYLKNPNDLFSYTNQLTYNPNYIRHNSNLRKLIEQYSDHSSIKYIEWPWFSNQIQPLQEESLQEESLQEESTQNHNDNINDNNYNIGNLTQEDGEVFNQILYQVLEEENKKITNQTTNQKEKKVEKELKSELELVPDLELAEPNLCAICCDQEASTLIIPCEHVILCKDCAKKLEMNISKDNAGIFNKNHCILCRTKIEEIIYF